MRASFPAAVDSTYRYHSAAAGMERKPKRARRSLLKMELWGMPIVFIMRKVLISMKSITPMRTMTWTRRVGLAAR